MLINFDVLIRACQLCQREHSCDDEYNRIGYSVFNFIFQQTLNSQINFILCLCVNLDNQI